MLVSGRNRAFALGISILATLAVVAASALPGSQGAAQTGTITTGTPTKSGKEAVTIRFKGPGSSVNDTLEVTVEGINGPPIKQSDPPQMTAEQKAQKIADAINATANDETEDADPKPITASATLDLVVIMCQGGEIRGVRKTNATRESGATSVSPGDGMVSVAEFTFDESASGLSLQGASSIVELGVGEVRRTYSLAPGLSSSDLLITIRDDFTSLGFSARIVGNSVIIVVPDNDARAYLDVTDALLEGAVGVSIL